VIPVAAQELAIFTALIDWRLKPNDPRLIPRAGGKFLLWQDRHRVRRLKLLAPARPDERVA
jgi:hypothetical protein